MLKGIQILRGIAALAVVYCHFAGHCNLASTGTWGVDIFFVLSGFIISSVVSKNPEHFLVKRIIRIVPLYWCATITMAILVLFVDNYTSINIVTNVVSPSIFIKSLFFIPYQIASKIEGISLYQPIHGVGWTLNFEMLFYVFCFLCILCIKSKKYIPLVSAALIALFVVFLNVSGVNHIFIFDWYKDYQGGVLPEFIYGIIIFYLHSALGCLRHFQPRLHFEKGDSFIQNRSNNYPKKKLAKTLISCVVMLICFILLIGHDTLDVQISTNRIIYYGIPSACIVFLMLCLEDIIGNNKPIRLLILLGDISYVIYLLHFFGVFILPYIEVRSNNTALEIIKLMMAILFVIITSFLVHKYFDMPLRRFLTRHLIQVKNEK